MSRIRVGVFLQNLSARRPRGVARVARALAEHLLEDPSLELYAIGDPSYDRVAIVAEHFDLADYLAAIPLVEPEPPGEDEATGKDRFRRFMLRWCRWALRSPWPEIAYYATRPLGVAPPLRKLYRWLRGKLPPPSSDLNALDAAVEEDRLAALGPTTLNKFDVLLSFEAFEFIWDWPRDKLRPALFGMVHDTLPLRIDEGPGGRPDHFFRALGKMTMRADRLLCVSEATQRDVLAFFPTAIGKTRVIMNGHDVERFAMARALPRQQPANRIRILMLGDIDRRKNVQNAFLAMPELARSLAPRQLELIIAGNDGHRRHFAHLQAIAERHCLVSWVGYVADDTLPALFASADVFLFPSLWEGFGIPVIEAMSAGVPVVCSELSSLPEVGGRHAFYCDPYDPSSLAGALVAACSMSPEERREWVADAASWSARFTWEHAARTLAGEIKAACGRESPALPRLRRVQPAGAHVG